MVKDNLYVSMDIQEDYLELIGRTDMTKVGYVIARINSAGEVSFSKGGCSTLGLKIVEK